MIDIKFPRSLSVRRVIFRKNVLTLGIIITGLLSIIMALLTYYGSYSGNFIVVVDEKDFVRGIAITDESEFSNPRPRLFADSIGNATDMTYSELKINNVLATDGNYFDPDYNYLAYTFYLKNTGNTAVDIKVTYAITELYRNVDKAIRVIVIEDDTIETIYKKPDSVEHIYKFIPNTTHFKSDLVIFENTILSFQPDQVKKFSVIVYIEGQDPDCTDQIYGGMIKMSLRFNIVDPTI